MPPQEPEQIKLEEALETAGQPPELTELNKANPALTLTPPISGLVAPAARPAAAGNQYSSGWPPELTSKALGMYQEGKSLHEISAATGRSYGSVSTKLFRELGSGRGNSVWADPAKQQQLESLVRLKVPYDEIARQMGLTKDQVYSRARLKGLRESFGRVRQPKSVLEKNAPKKDLLLDKLREIMGKPPGEESMIDSPADGQLLANFSRPLNQMPDDERGAFLESLA